MIESPAAPAAPPRPKPKFAQYLFDRSLSFRDAARMMGGVSYEQIRRICQPYDAPDYRPASQRVRQKIAAWTDGEIGMDDWSAPEVVA